MASWRIHVTAPDADQAKEFKEIFFKSLYQESGAKVTFEVPETDESLADQIVSAAEEKGLKAEKERFEDPLESSDTSVDFW